MSSPSEPIFIHGIMQRSGTNFLWQLLLKHPDCHPGTVGEDFLLKHAALLKRYSEGLFKNWTPAWRARYENSPDTILAKLGSCLISLIEKPYYLFPSENSSNSENAGQAPEYRKMAAGAGRLVTKTPSVDQLDLFFKLFPHAYLIILIRDGRSVVASGMKSFGWRFEEATRQWNAAAEEIIRFELAQRQTNKRYLIVKFEDLLQDAQGGTKKILDFLGLEPAKYNFKMVNSLPIYGSSEIRDTNQSVHWQPIRKDNTFNPTKRWLHWNDSMHSRFNWIAGKTMSRFNYALKPVSKSALFDRTLNLLHDAKYRMAKTLTQARQSIHRPG